MPADAGPRDVVAAFARAAERRQRGRPLLVTPERTLRYGEVVERAGKLAGLCAARGWKPGDRVAIACEDPCEVTLLYLALLRNGLASVVLDPGATPREVEAILEIAEPVAAFADRERAGAFRLPGGPEPVEVAPPGRRAGALFRKLVGRARPEDAGEAAADAPYPARLDAIDAVAPPAAVDRESDAHVLFTSGTTSRPKGVRIGHRALFDHLATLRRVYGYDEGSRILDVLPLHHTDGLVEGPVIAFTAGATVVRPGTFRIPLLPLLLDTVYAERITHFVAVPAILAMIDRLGADFEESFTTEDFRFVISTAGTLSESLWRRFEERFQTPVANVYGLTETVVGGLFAMPGDPEPRIGTVGRPVDCEVRLVDDAGAEVGPGEAGELELRGGHLMSGYLGSDEHPFHGDESGNDWLVTGDLAERTPEGAYRIVGRKKSLIVHGGINVQPEEVTEVLLALDGVTEAVTFGVPDEIHGERVVACVALDPAAGLRSSDLSAWCREHLAPEKRPSRIHLVDALPRGPAGKVRLDAVRELVARGAAAAGGGEGTIAERLVAIAAERFQLDPGELGPAARAADTPGWDSLGHLELVTDVETAFGIELATREILAIETLADLERIVAERLA